MIDGINLPGPSAPRTLRPSGVTVPAPVSSTREIERNEGTAPNPASDLAAAGPPVDAERVAAIRAAIEEGSYRANPEAIANKMVALDLPLTGE